jgi:CBS domain-containing protein
MNVDHILSEKGREVFTITPDLSLAEAARTLSQRRIGALLVSDPGNPVLGILSERDIVRALAANGPSALEEPVSRYMTGKVVTCTSHTAINDLMETMTTGKFRHVPVVENGRLIGLVSIGDIVKFRVAEIESESRALREYIATA